MQQVCLGSKDVNLLQCSNLIEHSVIALLQIYARCKYFKHEREFMSMTVCEEERRNLNRSMLQF